MNDKASTDSQKQQVAANFNLVSQGYDKLIFTRLCAERLVELAALQPGEQALDVGCGTGWATLAAAQKVGPAGKVVGIDLARVMLEQAQAKVQAAALPNVELREGDAQKLDFASASFDAVVSASVLFFLPDMLATLKEWQRVIRPGGRVVFSSFGSTFQQPLMDLYFDRIRSFGATLPPQKPGTALTDPQKCRALLTEAGFENITMREEQLGYYLDKAEDWWDIIWNGALRGFLSQLSPEQAEQFKAEHLADVENLRTAQGIWLDTAVIFSIGFKPA